MRIYNSRAESCQVYSHDVKEIQTCIEFPAIPGIFWNFCSGLKLQGLTKKFHLYISRKNLLATAGYLKVNEKTKYKSVPIFLLFLVVERKPEKRNYSIFEPAI